MLHTDLAPFMRPTSEGAFLARRPGLHGISQHGIELSVVMPCLNEADTLATCIHKARSAMDKAGIAGEVVVADNGSSDGSVDIARAAGARVVPVSDKGYGAALMGGSRPPAAGS